ncbi:MAG: hypothetical protein KAG18_00035 [Sinobacterium sp.]|nr:hypothetical protein [Sinobacterium sp.]
MFSNNIALRGTAILAAALFISACNSNFDVGFTSDNHPLLSVNDNYTETKYPVVLVHGLYGFDDIFGMDYWLDIPTVLENGGTEVYTAIVAGAHSPAVRGEQLITQLEEFSALSGMTRFHLMGHSLGAPTIRYAAAMRPDLVVSATSIAGVNYGSEAANNETIEPPLVRGIVSLIGNLLGHVIDTVSQNKFEQNILAATDAMEKEGADAFNAAYPVGLPSVYCNNSEASLVGFSHGTNGDYVENNPINSYDDFAAFYDGSNDAGAAGPYNINGSDVYFYSYGGNHVATHKSDPLDGLHKSVSKLIDGDDDDGFVERCSTHHGYVIKDNYPMNHMDFQNWVVGLREKGAPYAGSIFRAHIHHLKLLEISESL